jgi:hypothetical protein
MTTEAQANTPPRKRRRRALLSEHAEECYGLAQERERRREGRRQGALDAHASCHEDAPSAQRYPE